MLLFLDQQDAIFKFKDTIHEFDWLAKVAYLWGMFGVINKLNLNLQGITTHIFKVKEKVEATIKRLTIWKQGVLKGNFKYYPNC